MLHHPDIKTYILQRILIRIPSYYVCKNIYLTIAYLLTNTLFKYISPKTKHMAAGYMLYIQVCVVLYPTAYCFPTTYTLIFSIPAPSTPRGSMNNLMGSQQAILFRFPFIAKMCVCVCIFGTSLGSFCNFKV